MKTLEELQSGPACYEGLGWYFCRDGLLAKAVVDWREHGLEDEQSIGTLRDNHRYSFDVGGNFMHAGRRHRCDFILYVGPDEPKEKTLTEYLEARKPKRKLVPWELHPKYVGRLVAPKGTIAFYGHISSVTDSAFGLSGFAVEYWTPEAMLSHFEYVPSAGHRLVRQPCGEWVDECR